MNIAGIILAGGKSSRMGRDKSTLVIDNNQTMLDKAVEILTGICDELIIVSNSRNKYGYKNTKEIFDIYPEVGPLGGIHAGLSSCNNESALVVACDMPFLDSELIRFLVNQSFDFDVTVPKMGENIEPLHAVYSKGCLPYISQCIDNKIYRVVDFYPLVRVNYVEEKLFERFFDFKKVFYNVNTPDDYKSIIKMRGKGV